MPAEVISIRSKQPHLNGPVRCLHCKHEWEGVCEVGIISGLECPECGLRKGVFVALCCPGEGHKYYQCNCGNAHFMIVEGFTICALCGVKHTF